MVNFFLLNSHKPYLTQHYIKIRTKIAELKEASEHIEQNQVELIHSEKLAAIGRLIAGVAHELNSPLTSVKDIHNPDVKCKKFYLKN